MRKDAKPTVIAGGVPARAACTVAALDDKGSLGADIAGGLDRLCSNSADVIEIVAVYVDACVHPVDFRPAGDGIPVEIVGYLSGTIEEQRGGQVSARQ
ncbi:hypothetical protein G6F22_020206 [Rhizopus arrhizus]|nr:hypothetical protein G6F22_020206 [Rhizopus arrhizus]